MKISFKKSALLTVAFFGMGYPFLTAYAVDKAISTKEATSKKEVNVKVNGMVCSFCTNKLEKLFKDKGEVDQVHVDLDSKNIHVVFKESKDLADEEIKKIVTEAGYTVVDLKR